MGAIAQIADLPVNAAILGAAVTGTEQPQSYETVDGQPYADDFSNLIDERKSQLKAVCTTMDQRDEWARMIELIRCTLRRYFYIGIQHPYWNADAGQFQIGPSGSNLGDDYEDGDAEEFFEEEFNIFTANAKIFMAVFAQNAAPTRMEPDKPRDAGSVKATREAEKYVDVYQKYNPPKPTQMEVARLMWTDGRVVAVTEYKTDEEKCGIDEKGNPQGAEFTEYFGVLETKVPIIGIFKEWPYCKISKDKDITVAQEENPDYADQIEGGAKGLVPNNEIARMSRIAVGEGVAQVSADTLAYLVTEDRWWLRRSAFRSLPKEHQAFWIGDRKKQTPGVFPKGCRVKYIGNIFCGAHAISMDEQIRVMHAMPGNGNARPSLSDPMIPIQMEYNDAIGMYSEMLHKCIPRTLLNTEVESLEAITEQFSRYGEYSAFQPNNGPMQDNIFVEPGFDVPASFQPWVANLQGPLTQFITGNQPSLFGGDMEDQKTAKAYQLALNSSQGLMTIVWVPYLQFAAGINWQAARLAAKRDEKKISAVLPQKDGKSKTVDIDTEVLKRGGFLCTAVTDQNFPESHTDKANKWLGLFGAVPTNPIAAQVFTEPDNLVALKDATGLDIVIKGAVARDKQLAEWEEMLEGDGPVPDVEAQAQAQQQKQQAATAAIAQVAPGTPAPPVPPVPEILVSSVPIRLADDDIEEARTCVRILNEPKTIELDTTRPEVIEDLELHMKAHLTRAQQRGVMMPPDLIGIVPPLMPPGMPPGMPGAGAGLPPGAPPKGLPPSLPPGPAGAPGGAGAEAPPLAAPLAIPPLIPPPTAGAGANAGA